jgi:hypothetical protein
VYRYINRTCLFLGFLLCAVAAVSAQIAERSRPSASGRETRSLAGPWKFELDSTDKGLAGAWFNHNLADSVQLPGTTDTNQKGRKNDAAEPGRLSRKWTYSG